jgi:hypothetical protein
MIEIEYWQGEKKNKQIITGRNIDGGREAMNFNIERSRDR